MPTPPERRSVTVRRVPPLWFNHPANFGHEIPGHPERPQRIKTLEARMDQDEWFGWVRREAPPVARELLYAVHPERYVDFIEGHCKLGGPIDADTVAVEGTWELITRAAGGAVAVVDTLLGQEAPYAFSGMRPPGHHAEAEQAMGFCFFNSVAVAARHATNRHGLDRVLIFDWDVHHGNGTNHSFHRDSDILYASIHQSPMYPGTGAASDVGSGAGEGFTVNLPVPAGTGDNAFCSLTEHVVCQIVREWEPQLVLISAGFDAHAADPLASCQVTEAGYAGMAASVRRACSDVGAPLGLVLEGGYNVEALGESVAALAPVLSASEEPAAQDIPLHPLAEQAAGRLRRHWSSVGASAKG